MEDDLKLQDFDQWVKIFILKHEGENLSKESKISGHPTVHEEKLEGKWFLPFSMSISIGNKPK